MEGYRQAFREAGLSIDETQVVTGDFTYDVGHRVALELLRHGSRPTAILAQNDDMAVAAIAAARDLGLAVPADVSVAGFDNSEVSRTAWPQLTTVHQPVREMAWDAANRLITSLDGETDSAAPRRRDHPHELLVRASTAPPSR
jgi:LacI family transcriptional regulator